ncbi:hypothetical protein ParKJ_21520 [Paraburkholderia fungorum]|uniref:Uncharacterized protein n=1 Tax=Paraburkholderia fungorum TaxID=134537 RepID=A0AAP5UX79_9BURK|nr:hypothetical protein [Paraburkholderia fungorum]MDT8840012.1 hypothetical protein [Paraburkholderia fungorum]
MSAPKIDKIQQRSIRMPIFQEIEDVQELAKLSDMLTARISRQARYKRTRVVGYPSGKAEFPVNFESKNGSAVLWWSSKPSDDGEAIINLIGTGDPDSSRLLLIDLQFNVPIRRFARRHGGAFVRELESGAVLLAHRGIVTRGKSRVPRESLLAETSATTSGVTSSAGLLELFLVASLDSSTLLHDIANFSQEIRRAAEVVMDGGESAVSDKPPYSNRAAFDTGLGEYFDEFSGRRTLPSRDAVIVLVRHGSVVRQLSEALKRTGRVYKSALVDLAVVTKDAAYLFEVKTSTDTASVYMAVGQLSIHAIALAKQFAGKAVHKVMVVPGSPPHSIRERLQDELAIKVLSYEWNRAGPVTFSPVDLRSIVG